MYDSIAMSDWQTVLSLIEAVAWVVVLGVGLELITRKKFVSKQNRQILLILFATWAVANITLASMNTYNYFGSQRELIKQSIEAQKQYNL